MNADVDTERLPAVDVIPMSKLEQHICIFALVLPALLLVSDMPAPSRL